ncbi:hypothetical protein ABOM_005609 [Aspergillus bombycis]|uniref:Cyanovirin-N domain-containing protein n=1 Tax=Aspergillus bombycis TaxID=109264 RepID=A0A1F8A219_9EURO|nr:hypothetical protein ABOM_005609 [Aspergillus bombycis]OGM45385.1 hypothetical protein ABOM_005609 [Aspergillus bombycis]
MSNGPFTTESNTFTASARGIGLKFSDSVPWLTGDLETVAKDYSQCQAINVGEHIRNEKGKPVWVVG